MSREETFGVEGRLVRGRSSAHAVHGGGQWQLTGLDPSRIGEVIPADVNDPWYPPAPEVQAALRAALANVQHTPEVGNHLLVEALSETLGVEPRSLLVGSGSSPILQHLVASVCGPDRPLLVLAPTYAEYERAAHLVGAPVFRWMLRPEEGFEVEVEALGRAAAKCGAGLVALANPNNPTGRALPAEQVEALASSLSRGCLLLLDEAYVDQVPAASMLGGISRAPNVAVVRSLSKGAALGGVRMGYGAVGILWSRALPWQAPPWRLNLLAQSAALPALEAKGYIEDRVKASRRLQMELRATLGKLPGLWPLESECHFFLLRLEPPWPQASEVTAALRSRRVLVKDCEVYGAPLGGRYLRITSRSAVENRRLALAFQEVFEELRQ